MRRQSWSLGVIQGQGRQQNQRLGSQWGRKGAELGFEAHVGQRGGDSPSTGLTWKSCCCQLALCRRRRRRKKEAANTAVRERFGETRIALGWPAESPAGERCIRAQHSPG